MAYRENGFDWKKLEAFCQRGATIETCAALMDCSQEAIRYNLRTRLDCTFSEFRDKHFSTTKLKLIEKALDLAFKGKEKTLHKCLDNICGWKDKISVDQRGQAATFTLAYSPETLKKVLEEKKKDESET